MLTNTRTTRIEWGDCDPAGIIFYVRYYDIFDVSTTMLLERALGMKKIEYLKAYDFLGHPLVETRARFRAADAVRRRGHHRDRNRRLRPVELQDRAPASKGGTLAVEGFETRVWVIRDPTDPKRMKSQPIPAGVVARLTQRQIRH